MIALRTDTSEADAALDTLTVHPKNLVLLHLAHLILSYLKRPCKVLAAAQRFTGVHTSAIGTQNSPNLNSMFKPALMLC